MKTLLSLLLGLILTGCGTLSPQGIYQGDEILYTTELAIPTSYDVCHSFIVWEFNNRKQLSGWPEIKKHADNIRKNYPQWEGTVKALHDAYKSDPSQVNKDKLKVALAVLQAALTQSTTYMVQAATAK